MSGFTLDDLRTVMRECVGVDESVDLAGDIGDVAFAELGYDSLAVLELASQVQRTWGVPLTDTPALEARTPGAFVAYVNDNLTEAGR
ncbi:actinorhodin polyketide synthase [Streptomyces mashuensis]|uniref:Actinorhodin polyketide synthase n=1 Tax=Streptomyces mashuensis TaxID=33904 RepID=A0A919B9I9_9ACTN|nr:acyl carrier protein [Streptomyces mashuensis]GHF69270.1 actinorhodin polyketide synthase [Streptomyces mashuensis]